MTMTTDPAAARALLERMIRSFTKHQEDLEVAFQEHPGGILFTIACHGAEGPRICGKKGRNIRSLQTIFGEIGRHNCRVYAVRLQDPEFGDWEQRVPEPLAGPYDPTAAAAFLDAVLAAILGKGRAKVLASTAANLTAFQVTGLSTTSMRILTTTHEWSGLTVLEALQTIWKAYGKEEAWNFVIEVR